MSTITGSRITGMSPQFLVADLERSIKFYVARLGFELQFRYEDFYAGIVKDGFTIHLKLSDTTPSERKQPRDNEDLDIVFSVTGVEELFAEYKSQGVRIVTPLCDRPYGKEFYIADPDDHILAFLESR